LGIALFCGIHTSTSTTARWLLSSCEQTAAVGVLQQVRWLWQLLSAQVAVNTSKQVGHILACTAGSDVHCDTKHHLAKNSACEMHTGQGCTL
jgi:hypothetical protein